MLPLAGVASCRSQALYQGHQLIVCRWQEKSHSCQQESPSGEIVASKLSVPSMGLCKAGRPMTFSFRINWFICQNNSHTCGLFKSRAVQTFKIPAATVSQLSCTVCLTSSKSAVPTRTFCSCLFSVIVAISERVSDLVSTLPSSCTKRITHFLRMTGTHVWIFLKRGHYFKSASQWEIARQLSEEYFITVPCHRTPSLPGVNRMGTPTPQTIGLQTSSL